MLADRFLAFLHDRVGFVVTRWSVLRIAVVAAAALVAGAVAVPAQPGDRDDSPYNNVLATSRVRNVALPLGDPRGFDATASKGDFRVAWIGGSETMAVGAKTRAFIPGLVSERIGTVDGKELSTDLYYLNAIRLADELSALSTALSSRPDLVVISLNPVWVLNDLAVQQWSYLDGNLARGSLWPPSRWPVAASLVSPGDVGWRALSTVSPSLVGDRFEWGVDIAAQTAPWTFLDVVKPKRTPAPTGLAKLATRRPVDFWFSYFEPTNPGTSLTVRQLGIMEREIASRSSINRAVLRQMFEMVRSAGVDAYFYVHPIDPKVYAEPDARRYVASLRAALTEAAAGQTTERLVFDPQGLQDRVAPSAYRDIAHVLDGTNEAEVLARDLCALLVTTGRQPLCEAP
ncbi:hypothetical protein ACFQU3_05395 [Terrabacter sp. GCM10028922]|uniref:hypothetical protein n=1 Tax=Terrabacter sp. GCM10028922 TaxID=3273428 RepID=UPI003611ADF6